MTSTSLRPLRRLHVPAWYALQRQGIADPYSEPSLGAELSNPLARTHGLFRGRELIAVILAWQVVDELQIMQVVVAPAERRRGHGRRLVQHALTRARASGATTCTLEVRTSNAAAIGLYGAMGFAVVGLRRGYYPDGEDALLMRRLLSGERLPAAGARAMAAEP